MLFRSKTDRRYDYLEATSEFTISFTYGSKEENALICENEDIKVAVENGFVTVKCDNVTVTSTKQVTDTDYAIVVVREKNKLLKLYIDRKLDGSGYDANAKGELNTQLESNLVDFSVKTKAESYNEIISLKNILTKAGKRKK